MTQEKFTGAIVARLIALVSFLSVLAYVWAAALGAVTFSFWPFALFALMGLGGTLANFATAQNAETDVDRLEAEIGEIWAELNQQL